MLSSTQPGVGGGGASGERQSVAGVSGAWSLEDLVRSYFFTLFLWIHDESAVV